MKYIILLLIGLLISSCSFSNEKKEKISNMKPKAEILESSNLGGGNGTPNTIENGNK